MNAVGRRQAADLRAYFAGTTFDAVYTSPLRRALKTAHGVAKDSPILPDARLSEIHHGCWQGWTKRDIARRWRDQWERWQKEPLHFTPHGGEPASHVRMRVEDFLRSIRGNNILCVSHGVIIQNLRSILLGTSNEHARMPLNGSIDMFYFRRNNLCEHRVLSCSFQTI
jgi:alpha-ribazole phosphatase/probable phosphoglycerate mutase